MKYYMQLHTILHIYSILNYMQLHTILHACNYSVITCKLHAITCNITWKLHTIKTFDYKRFKFQRYYMMFQVIACNYMFIKYYMIITCVLHAKYMSFTCPLLAACNIKVI